MERAVENALMEVARIRAARELHMTQRAEMQRKAAAILARPPVYVLRKYGGQQLAFDLDDGSARKTH